MTKYITLIAICIAISGCAKSSNLFDNVGTNIASPAAMTVDVTSNRLYIVNSNSKVLYDPMQGSFQILDITNPLAPSIVQTVQTLSFSGQMYLDTITKRAYVPNRYSASNSVTTSTLYNINVDEASSSLATITESTIGQNAFGIACCYPANRAWITTSLNELQYVDLGGSMTANNIPLTTTLDNGVVISNASVDFVTIIGTRAFLSCEWGGIMVVNLDLAGVAGSVPVNYFINDIDYPNGFATDGTLLYVVAQGSVNDTWLNYLAIIDPSSLTPKTDNTSTQVVNVIGSGMLLALIEVGNSPQEVLLTTSYAFVTNQNDDTVSVIDLASRTKIKDIPVGDQPFSLALYRTLAGTDQYVYVGNLASDTISIIDINALEVVATYP